MQANIAITSYASLKKETIIHYICYLFMSKQSEWKWQVINHIQVTMEGWF